MLNRREFISAAVAGAALWTRGRNAFAATYDLIIKGGRVIDPSLRLDAIRDVAISGGRIVAVEADITSHAADTEEFPVFLRVCAADQIDQARPQPACCEEFLALFVLKPEGDFAIIGSHENVALREFVQYFPRIGRAHPRRKWRDSPCGSD